MMRLLVCVSLWVMAGSVLQADTCGICDAKKMDAGTWVVLGNKVVSRPPSSNGQGFHIAEPDGACGILVVPEPGMAISLVTGEVVTVEGTVGLSAGEACIYASSVTSQHTLQVAPLFAMNSSTLGGGEFGLQLAVSGGVGLNNTGLLVRTCGQVIDAAVGEFTIGGGDGTETIVTLPDPTMGSPTQGQFVVVTGISSVGETDGKRVRKLKPRSKADVSPVIPDLRVEPAGANQVAVRWTASTQGATAVKLDGVIRPFREWLPASIRVQAVTYAPTERLRWGESLTPEALDRDLDLIRLANANTVNLYDLAGAALTQPVIPGGLMTVQEYIAEKCKALGLKIVARLEWYPKQPYQDWTFSFDVHSPESTPHRDAEAALAYYSSVLELFSRPRYKDTLCCYLVNMPMDDQDVQGEFTSDVLPHFPTADQQREYVCYLRTRIDELSPGARVMATAHYSVADVIPVAPIADLVDGIALTAYPTRCNSTPFTTGLTPVRCDQPADPALAPSMATSPWFVTCGVNQVEFWLDKLMHTNRLSDWSKIMLDGTGFAPDVTHWAGLVSDEQTKIQAIRDFFGYFGESGLAGTMQFGLLDKQGEASWGIVVPEQEIVDAAFEGRHEVTVNGLTPGATYRARVKQGEYWSVPVTYHAGFPCGSGPFPSITVTSPHYGNALLTDDNRRQVTWTTRNMPQSLVGLYADTDDRGLDGTFVGAGDSTSGGAEADFSALPAGGYNVFAKAPVGASCAVPGGEVWGYSLGRVIKPAVVEGNRCVVSAERCGGEDELVFDGVPDEPFWQDAVWTTYAVHPAGSGSTRARVKLKYDADFLYLAFDVDDDYVETNDAAPWDGDCVSVWLRKVAPSELSTYFGIEVRQDACRGDNSRRSKASAKTGTVCNDNTGLDSGYTVEMRIPWSDIGTLPTAGMALECDFMSVDHDANPGGGISPPTVFSKLFWDRDGTGERLGGAIVLAE